MISSDKVKARGVFYRFFLEARKSKFQKFCFLDIISMRNVLYKNGFMNFSWKNGHLVFLTAASCP
jgi:hypothetical protein